MTVLKTGGRVGVPPASASGETFVMGLDFPRGRTRRFHGRRCFFVNLAAKIVTVSDKTNRLASLPVRIPESVGLRAEMTVPDGQADALMTTAEVARLLRVKERKIYDLVAEDGIPHTKVTGKLLFPRELIEDWLRSGTTRAGAAGEADRNRPPIAGGSHDPLLEWALVESGCGIGPLFDGSLDGFERFRRGEVLFAGMHVPGPPESGDSGAGPVAGYNQHLLAEAQRESAGLVLVTWAVRRQGLMIAPGAEGARDAAGLAALAEAARAGLLFKRRQESAGSRVLLDRLLDRAGIAGDAIAWSPGAARTETEAALSILDGDAQAAFGIEAVARRFGLAFTPLAQERYDLLVAARDVFAQPMQDLLAFTRSDAFAAKASGLGGYDIRRLGLRAE